MEAHRCSGRAPCGPDLWLRVIASQRQHTRCARGSGFKRDHHRCGQIKGSERAPVLVLQPRALYRGSDDTPFFPDRETKYGPPPFLIRAYEPG